MPRRHASRSASARGGMLVVAALGLGSLTSGVAAARDAVATGASALNEADAAQWQRLLQQQAAQTAVKAADTRMPIPIQSTYDRLFAWNEVALDTTAIDHTPVPPGGTYVFGQQFGPPRSARAMAIVHIAMFEAINAVTPTYRSYVGLAAAHGPVSVDVAIARAAHDTLVYLYPSQAPRLDALLANDLATIGSHAPALAAGNALGTAAAAAIIALRRDDGSARPEPSVGDGPNDFHPIGGVGHWSIDPVSQATVALGAYWGQVRPFVIKSADQFLPPPPPTLDSLLYTLAYYQEIALGGDPMNGTPTFRTPAQTEQGIFWTYDGTPNLCAPPRLYNQLARTVLLQQKYASVVGAARFLALLNTAMADAALTAWNAKWHYQFWRPVTAIRYQGQQGNPLLKGIPTWYPLGGQATNTHGPNFTPPFPAYPSGHATFGGSVFETLRALYPDNTPFTFVSDEFNGQNYDIYGNLMPYRPVTYQTLSQAEYDNAESRIWIGVHWQFDADQGDAAGRKVSDWVVAHAFQPLATTSAATGAPL